MEGHTSLGHGRCPSQVSALEEHRKLCSADHEAHEILMSDADTIHNKGMTNICVILGENN